MIRDKYKVYLKYIYDRGWKIPQNKDLILTDLGLTEDEFLKIHIKTKEKNHIAISEGFLELTFDGIDYCEHCCLNIDEDTLEGASLEINYQPL